MTLLRTAPIATLAAVLLLAGCASPDSTPPATAPSVESTAAPAPDTETIPAPGEEICEIKADFDRIDGILIKANRENPPAPSYRDAWMQVSAVIPPNSIKAEWLELRDRLADYVPIVERGDSAELAEQADEVTAISELHLKLFGYFASLCA